MKTLITPYTPQGLVRLIHKAGNEPNSTVSAQTLNVIKHEFDSDCGNLSILPIPKSVATDADV